MRSCSDTVRGCWQLGWLGLGGALALGKILGSLLYQTNAIDPVVFGSVTALLAAIALVACWLPARRATKVNSMVALRAG